MKKLKSIMLLVLAALMCFSLMACAPKNETDWARVQRRKNFVMGYTVYDPMFIGTAKNASGFDVELAKEVASLLGVKVKFQEIDWGQKVSELDSRAIDVIWNGMTITDELKNKLDYSAPYLNNRCVLVVRSQNASKYPTKESVLESGKAIAAEAGSSGEKVVKGDSVLSSNAVLPVIAQIDALNEVSSGNSEFACVDGIMFDSMKKKSDDNPNLPSVVKDLVKLTLEFPAEQFGIGFRKGSDFLAKVEESLATLKSNGKFAAIAAKYGLTDLLVED